MRSDFSLNIMFHISFDIGPLVTPSAAKNLVVVAAGLVAWLPVGWRFWAITGCSWLSRARVGWSDLKPYGVVVKKGERLYRRGQ